MRGHAANLSVSIQDVRTKTNDIHCSRGRTQLLGWIEVAHNGRLSCFLPAAMCVSCLTNPSITRISNLLFYRLEHYKYDSVDYVDWPTR